MEPTTEQPEPEHLTADTITRAEIRRLLCVGLINQRVADGAAHYLDTPPSERKPGRRRAQAEVCALKLMEHPEHQDAAAARPKVLPEEAPVSMSRLALLREQNNLDRASLLNEARRAASQLRDIAQAITRAADEHDVARLISGLTYYGLDSVQQLQTRAKLVADTSKVIAFLEKP